MYNAAIVGCGRIFSTHATAIQKHNNVNLKLVVDIDEARALNAADEYNCEYSSRFDSILERNDIDVIHICTPHYLHAKMAIDALKSGKHVLIEKPMAITDEDAKKIIMTAKTTQKQLGVCFQNRYNSTSKWIKEFLNSGRAGKIISARCFFTWFRDENYYKSDEWRGTWEKEGGGVLINQAIHTLDLIQWFMGEPEWLKAKIDTRMLKDVIEVEDTADVTIKFKSGAHVTFVATNNYTMDSPPLIEFHCEKAIIRLEDDIKVTYTDGSNQIIQNQSHATGNTAYWGLSHEKLINDFYQSILNNQVFAVDGNEAVKSIKLINQIYHSSSTNEFVKF